MTKGDIYQLLDDLGEIQAGIWVVTDIGMRITLARVGENEDGDLCRTWRTATVTRDDMERFTWLESAENLLK